MVVSKRGLSLRINTHRLSFVMSTLTGFNMKSSSWTVPVLIGATFLVYSQFEMIEHKN